VSTWRAVRGGSLLILSLVLALAPASVSGQGAPGPRIDSGTDGAGTRDLRAQRLPRRPGATEEEKPAEPAKPEPAAPAAQPPGPPLRTPMDPPLGFTVPPSGIPAPSPPTSDFVPQVDRWRIGFPRWDRYGRAFDVPYVEGQWWNPYRQNILKGDYPIWGQNIFFSVTGVSDTLFEARKLPTPSGVAAARPKSSPFFGEGEQYVVVQNWILQLELFEGIAAFRPRDWEIRITPIVNLNYVDTKETVVDVDPREGTTRLDSFTTLIEAFAEYHIADVSPFYDFVSVKAGIQPFLSDFRGFIFADNELGGRLFGNYLANRLQYNLAYFYMLEKDTNSGLVSFDTRHQHVGVANLYFQDFIWPGYTAQFSVHYNRDNASTQFDDNGFIVRPSPIGGICAGAGGGNCPVRPHTIDALYLGWAGDGHIGRLNLSHAVYQVLGRDEFNPIPAREVDINAQLVALEASVELDWLRPKVSFLWASGDSDPTDDTARGFDAIFDNPNFAGGAFSFWGRQGIALRPALVNLKSRNSLFPTLRTSKEQGQANFVNPGLFLYNVGLDANVTPKLRTFLNLNYLRFQDTASLQQLLFQSKIDEEVGWDVSVGVQYRPLLIDNVVLSAGFAVFVPGKGFKDIYESSDVLYSAFGQLTLTY
jgi:hypothetical protein